MAGRIDQRLKDLGIELPRAAAPAGSYVPFVITGSLVVVSGQLPLWNGEMRYRGPIGAGLTIAGSVFLYRHRRWSTLKARLSASPGGVALRF